MVGFQAVVELPLRKLTEWLRDWEDAPRSAAGYLYQKSHDFSCWYSNATKHPPNHHK